MWFCCRKCLQFAVERELVLVARADDDGEVVTGAPVDRVADHADQRRDAGDRGHHHVVRRRRLEPQLPLGAFADVDGIADVQCEECRGHRAALT